LAAMMAVAAALVLAPCAAAQEEPLGYVHILGIGGPSNSVVSLDVENDQNVVDGLVHFKQPEFNRDSQLWDELPAGIGASALLRSKKNLKLCLAATDSGNITTTRPCGDDNTIWDETPMGGNMFLLQLTTPRIIGPDKKLCLVTTGTLGAPAEVQDCTEPIIGHIYFGDNEFWSLEQLGLTSQPLIANPPPKPTGCKVFGSGGVCGDVGFNCNPLSAADRIIVATGANIGVSVLNLEPALGLINGHYQNQGQTAVSICAVNVKAGTHACSDQFDVTFGPLLCAPGAPPSGLCPHTCPAHEIHCGCACKLPSACSILQ